MKRQDIDDAIALAGLPIPDSDIEIFGEDPVFYGPFHLAEGAAVTQALIGSQVDQIWKEQGHTAQQIKVDARHAAASLNSAQFLSVPEMPIRDTLGENLRRIYKCADGRYFQLHSNFGDTHALAALLGVSTHASVQEIASVMSGRNSFELEDLLVEKNMTGGVVRTTKEWAAHAQGRILSNKPVVELTKIAESPPESIEPSSRPLSNLRVLDLTRVLAGPTCARSLAEHGADVFHVASPHLPTVEVFEMDTGHGKRQIHIDLNDSGQADILRNLAKSTDVFNQGFRKGALDKRGFGPDDMAKLRPGVIYVSENCYGHEGPWANRPGYEQYSQIISGLADLQGKLAPLEPNDDARTALGDDPQAPRLVGAAVNDYTTAYFAAYGVLEALRRRAVEGGSWHVQVSLTQTSMWFQKLGLIEGVAPGNNLGNVSEFLESHDTPYGEMTHLAPSLQMSETQPYWAFGSRPLGSDSPEW
jgi:crotonobetainyl-CoA:carnitine CoA-transferase CaiB-like acyl-CoA transferase